jgi:hypothetical protein
MAKALYLVYTNCEPGREAEFKDWYETVHLPDLLRVEGIVAAQRFRLTGPGPQTLNRAGEPAVAQYLAVYELDTEDTDAVLERIAAARSRWQMFDGLQLVAGARYVALGERHAAPAAAAAATTS